MLYTLVHEVALEICHYLIMLKVVTCTIHFHVYFLHSCQQKKLNNSLVDAHLLFLYIAIDHSLCDVLFYIANWRNASNKDEIKLVTVINFHLVCIDR